MRTEKELWEVVLSRQDLFWFGLCGWVMSVQKEGEISWYEWKYLERVLDDHLPSKEIRWIWCWERGRIQPRIDWIIERIKKLESCQF